MNHTYPSLAGPFSISSKRGVALVSALQKEVDAILARVPVGMFDEKLAEQTEECFDADGALAETTGELRLEMPIRILKEKNIVTARKRRGVRMPEQSSVKQIVLTHTHSNAPVIMWEKPCARGYVKATVREMYRKGAAVLRVTQKRVDADHTRTHNTVNISNISRTNTRGRMPKYTPTMQYQHRKFVEFIFSTATTFALFAFLLVQADFIPEVPHAVLADQVAGPAFAVADVDSSISATTTAVTTDIDIAPVILETPSAARSNSPVSGTISSGNGHTTPSHTTTSAPVQTARLTGALPDRIVIGKIGLDVPVGIPVSNDIGVLDAVLLKGAALYPGSGTLDQERNLLILGHSSHLPIVRNQAYRAFNNIEKLVVGDTIQVFSGSRTYVYRVTNVKLVPAPEAMVRFNTGKRELTLVTCDNFGAKTDRYVVSADFVGTQ